MKRIYTLILCLLLILSMASCGKPAVQEPQTTEKPKAEATQTTAKEPVKITIELYDRSNTPEGTSLTDSFLTRYIADNFTAETNISVEYVPVPRNNDDDKIQVLMASNSAPDIVFSYSSARFYSYASNGGLAELTDDLLKTNAPDLIKILADVLPYGRYDGKQYAINAKRALTGIHNSFIRKDLLDAMNLPLPTTAEELYETLKAVKAADPGGIGSENVIPYGMHGSTTGTFNMCYYQLIHGFIDFEKMTLEESRTLPIELQPGAREGFRFMNKMYNEGMISRDFALDDNAVQFNQDVVTGKVLFFSEDRNKPYGSSANGLQITLEQNVPGAVLYPVDTFLNANGKYMKTLYPPTGMFIMIPKASEKRAWAALQYLNFLGNNFIPITLGTEGVHYEMADGLPVKKEENSAQINLDLWNGFDLILVYNGNDYGNLELNMRSSAKTLAPHEDLAMLGCLQSQNDGYTPFSYNRPIDAEIKYSAALGEVVKELVIKSVMAAPAEFDATYDAIYSKWLEEGGQKVIDEKLEVLRSQ